MKIFRLWVLFIGLVVFVSCSIREYSKVIDLPLGVIEDSFVVSKDGKNYAYLVYNGSKISVFINSVLVGEYESVSRVFFMDSGGYFFNVFEKDKNFIVQDGISHNKYDYIEYINISGDGNFLVYLAKISNYSVIVSNGVEIGKFEKIFSDSLVVSSNGRIGFVGYSSNKYYVVIDGIEKLVDDMVIRNSLKFDPMGRFWSVVVKNKNNTYTLFINGISFGIYESILLDTPIFSYDGSKFIFAFMSNNMVFVYYTNSIFGPYEEVLYNSISFSPDGNRFGFVVRSNNYFFYVIDGIPQKPYKFIGENSLIFSRDGKNFSFVAGESTNQMFVVENGIESYSYGIIVKDSLSYDADNKLVYLVKSGDKYFVVYDGVPQKEFEMIYNLKVSPKGNFVVYVAEENNREVVLVNNVYKGRYDYVGDIYFSLDSNHYGYVAKNNEKWFVVIDGIEQKKYSAIGVFSDNIFVDNNTVSYLALKNDKFYLIREYFR